MLEGGGSVSNTGSASEWVSVCGKWQILKLPALVKGGQDEKAKSSHSWRRLHRATNYTYIIAALLQEATENCIMNTVILLTIQICI